MRKTAAYRQRRDAEAKRKRKAAAYRRRRAKAGERGVDVASMPRSGERAATRCRVAVCASRIAARELGVERGLG